ncbi:hypothetical protein LY78DRAFT_643021 [Colletotrichum sublineola]|nr:hypothetical protein LY78DRAFT_643021 [Colletotrichum sublineola]
MKLSVTFAALALAISSAQACAKYKNCWCEKNGVEYQGKIQDNIAWDNATKAACDNEGGEAGWYGNNFMECYRYKKGGIIFFLSPTKAIQNCEWTEKCKAAGGDIGYCREKI